MEITDLLGTLEKLEFLENPNPRENPTHVKRSIELEVPSFW